MDLHAVISAWPIFLSAIALIAWNIRLEAKVTYLEKDFDNYKITAGNEITNFKNEFTNYKVDVRDKDRELWGKIDSLRSDFQKIIQSVSRIETKLEHIEHGRNDRV